MTWQWRACSPGDQFAIVPVEDDGELLPYSVAKVGPLYEAWLRHPNPRGGYWGGEMLGRFHDPHEARQACMDHAGEVAPSPTG